MLGFNGFVKQCIHWLNTKKLNFCQKDRPNNLSNSLHNCDKMPFNRIRRNWLWSRGFTSFQKNLLWQYGEKKPIIGALSTSYFGILINSILYCTKHRIHQFMRDHLSAPLKPIEVYCWELWCFYGGGNKSK